MSGRYKQPRAEELAYLAELLEVFGHSGAPPVENAAHLIHTRYFLLYEQTPALAPAIWDQPEDIVRLVQALHGYLYDGILNNAGRFRSTGDPGGSKVYFGGLDPRRGIQPRFTGVPPHDIAPQLLDAARLLSRSDDPVRASVVFYQELSRIHPFYDANGRVGRLLANGFLYPHGKYVAWRELDGSYAKFMRKLNTCHKRHESSAQALEQARGWLTSYWRKYVRPLEEE